MELERRGGWDRMKMTQTQVHELRGVCRVIRPALRSIVALKNISQFLNASLLLCCSVFLRNSLVPSSAIMMLFLFMKIAVFF